MNCDWLAPHYHWIERAAFGGNLQRCRLGLLADVTRRLPAQAKVLILGEGDGRFLARSGPHWPDAQIDLIDNSPRMLQLAQRRLERQPAKHCPAVHFLAIDARQWARSKPDTDYDLIITHFFLDCFAGEELAELINGLSRWLRPGGYWWYSDFASGTGSAQEARRNWFKLRLMYLAFRLATGLETGRLDRCDSHFSRLGMSLVLEKSWQRGFLISQLWQNRTASVSRPDQ